jgi:hypothetical protein
MTCAPAFVQQCKCTAKVEGKGLGPVKSQLRAPRRIGEATLRNLLTFKWIPKLRLEREKKRMMNSVDHHVRFDSDVFSWIF